MWQTIADAKAKDKTERIGCGGHRAATTTQFAMPVNTPGVSTTTMTAHSAVNALPPSVSHPSTTHTIGQLTLPPITNADVIHYTKIGLSDKVIINLIGEAQSPGSVQFDLRANALSDLADHGVSPAVITLMQKRGANASR